MISTLYKCFQPWSDRRPIYLISDTHFDDSDCFLMDINWPYAIEYTKRIKEQIGKNTTLIHLGDVGDPKYMDMIPGYKVLIKGNHDRGSSFYQKYFDEIFSGPLFVGDRLLLSHEPIYDLNWCFNIHGHDHNPEHTGDDTHMNITSNVIGYRAANLKDIIRSGYLSKVDGLHRTVIKKRVT